MKIQHAMPTLHEDYDWMKVHPKYFEDKNKSLDVKLSEYHLSESNIRPVEATTIELGYEIDRLKKDAAFHKHTLINYQNETQAQLKDYQNLHVDYLNSQYKVKQLQAQVDKMPALKRTIRYMMAEHLDIELGDK